MREIKVGDVVRVLRHKAHYSIKGTAHLELIDHLTRLLFVVDAVRGDPEYVAYPLQCSVHPLYAQLFDPDKFFDMFAEDELEVMKDEQD